MVVLSALLGEIRAAGIGMVLPWNWAVKVKDFALFAGMEGRVCGEGDPLRLRSGQALAPLVKTRVFGMTPLGWSLGAHSPKSFQVEPLPEIYNPLTSM
jgi:hypothetical protein